MSGKRRKGKEGNGAKPLPEKPGTPAKTREQNSGDKTPLINEDIDIVKDELHLLDDIKINPEDVGGSSLSHPDPEATNTNPGAVINPAGTRVKKEEDLDPGEDYIFEKGLLENNWQGIREHTEVETEAERIVLRFEINNVVTSILDVVDLERMLDGEKKSHGRQRKPGRLSTTRPKLYYYWCVSCRKRFVSRPEAPPLTFCHCGQRLRAAPQHPRSGLKDKPFACKLCGKVFKRSSGATSHFYTHTKEVATSCEQCGKGLSCAGSLRRHMLTHVTVKPYGCDHCEKSFPTAPSLHTHIITRHIEHKPFVCQVCGRGFSIRRYLTRHEVIHLDYKPFGCDVCGKKFRWLAKVKEHARVHTKEKPYTCQICAKSFVYASSLRLHNRKHSTTHTM